MNLNKESIKHYLRQHKIDDFLLEFEAEGLKLLFQELMYEHYYPEKSLMIFRNNIVKSLILNSVWNNKGEEGIKKLSDPEDTTFKDIEVNIKKLKNEISVLATKTNLTKNDVISAFEIFENAAQEYAFFNMAHFEKAYECSDKNEILSKNIGIVENLKDKVKVDFNKIFFFSDCYWTDLLKKICGQFNIDEGLIEWHMKEELLALFEGETVSSNEIEQRKRAYVFYEFENKKLFIKTI